MADVNLTWSGVEVTVTDEYLDLTRVSVNMEQSRAFRDWRVPIQHAQKLKRELEKNGKVEVEDFWWMVKTDEGHGFYKEANKMELYSELEKFFGRYLKDS